MHSMSPGYLIVVALGIAMLVTGFWGAFIRKGGAAVSTLLSLCMPAGMVITIIGIILTVLPDFFKDPVW